MNKKSVRPYNKIPQQKRDQIIQSVFMKNQSYKQISDSLGINCSTVKSIIRIYKKEKRSYAMKKKPRKAKPHQLQSQIIFLKNITEIQRNNTPPASFFQSYIDQTKNKAQSIGSFQMYVINQTQTEKVYYSEEAIKKNNQSNQSDSYQKSSLLSCFDHKENFLNFKQNLNISQEYPNQHLETHQPESEQRCYMIARDKFNFSQEIIDQQAKDNSNLK